MKTFIFKYSPDATPKALFSEMEKAIKTGVPRIQRNELASNSVSSILSTMTAGRIQLFYAIAMDKPESIYRLSQMQERDQANVIRDVKTLEGLGLIKLVSEQDGDRERLRPVALYDRIVFDFGEAKTARSHPR